MLFMEILGTAQTKVNKNTKEGTKYSQRKSYREVNRPRLKVKWLNKDMMYKKAAGSLVFWFSEYVKISELEKQAMALNKLISDEVASDVIG